MECALLHSQPCGSHNSATILLPHLHHSQCCRGLPGIRNRYHQCCILYTRCLFFVIAVLQPYLLSVQGVSPLKWWRFVQEPKPSTRSMSWRLSDPVDAYNRSKLSTTLCSINGPLSTTWEIRVAPTLSVQSPTCYISLLDHLFLHCISRDYSSLVGLDPHSSKQLWSSQPLKFGCCRTYLFLVPQNMIHQWLIGGWGTGELQAAHCCARIWKVSRDLYSRTCVFVRVYCLSLCLDEFWLVGKDISLDELSKHTHKHSSQPALGISLVV